jgi:hypothetical protein
VGLCGAGGEGVTLDDLGRLRASLSRTSAAKWGGQWVSVMAGRVVACPDPAAPDYESTPGIDVAWQVRREDADAICALHNAAPTLLTAAEPTVLLGEVRTLAGEGSAVGVLSPGMHMPNVPPTDDWHVVAWCADGREIVGTGPTELEALRDALRRLMEPKP